MSVTTPQPPRPLRLFLISHPRTASNLLCKLFSKHPAIRLQLYPFANTDSSFQANFDLMQRLIAESEAMGKIPFIKDHSIVLVQAQATYRMFPESQGMLPQSNIGIDNKFDLPHGRRALIPRLPYFSNERINYNPTILSDRFAETLTPVIMIRHPAKQVESLYKIATSIDIPTAELPLQMSFIFSRRIFEYYRDLYSTGADNNHVAANRPIQTTQEQGHWPIVIDGDDLIDNTEGLAERFCKITGLDPSGIIYKWEVGNLEAVTPLRAAYFGTLMKSEGVIKNMSPKVPNIAESSMRWAETWGEDVAHILEKHAEAAMADYEYLHQYRIRA